MWAFRSWELDLCCSHQAPPITCAAANTRLAIAPSSSKRESSRLSLLTPGAKSSPYSSAKSCDESVTALPPNAPILVAATVIKSGIAAFVHRSVPGFCPIRIPSLMRFDTASASRLAPSIRSCILRTGRRCKRIFRIDLIRFRYETVPGNRFSRQEATQYLWQN